MPNITRVQLSADGWTLNILSERVATITDPIGTRKVSYFGFETEEKARVFKEYLEANRLCTAATIRKAERLQQVWECKVWGAPTELIVKLARLNAIPVNEINS